MKRKNKWGFILISLCCLFFVTSFTIAYAFSDKILNLNGDISVSEVGEFKVTSIVLDTTQSNSLPENFGQGLYLKDDGTIGVEFNLNLSKTSVSYYATYLITLDNGYYKDYIFNGFSIASQVNVSGASESDASATISHEYVDVSGSTIGLGDTIASRSTEVIAVKLYITASSTKDNTSIGISGGADVNTTTDVSGQFYGAIDNNTIDLQNNSIDCFTFHVINTYSTAKTFTISSGNSNFEFVNSSGGSLGSFSINAPSSSDANANEQSYNACVKTTSSAVFVGTSDITSVIITSDGNSQNIGTLNVAVNQSASADFTPISVSNVTFTPVKYNTSDGSLSTTATWQRDDSGGSSVSKYYIALYDSSSSSLVETFEINASDVTESGGTISYNLTLNSTFLSNNKTNMVTNNHSYYIKVYGLDAAGNSGESYCSSTSAYCASSATTSLKYEFSISVTTSSSASVSFVNSSTKIYYKAAFSDVVQVTTNNYTLSGDVTVTMDGTSLTADTQYSYALQSGSSTKANFTINEGYITGDVTVSVRASGSCLVKGTKVILANGETKNIENVDYNDLLLVINHDTGKLSYEYPIWIEKEGKSTIYQKTTFSDGSVLKTVGYHGVFSFDDNAYVSVDDLEKFKIGTNVAKLNANNEIVSVSVTNIEFINEEITYYQVVSNRYLNILADNFITIDGTMTFNNNLKFDNNLVWHSQNTNNYTDDLFNWYDYSNYKLNYLITAFNSFDNKIKGAFYNGSYSINNYASLLLKLIKEPSKSSNGNYLFNININNEQIYEYEYGDIFILPNEESNNFIGYYNHADNNMYQPNDEVIVKYSMYFEKIYK